MLLAPGAEQVLRHWSQLRQCLTDAPANTERFLPRESCFSDQDHTNLQMWCQEGILLLGFASMYMRISAFLCSVDPFPRIF